MGGSGHIREMNRILKDNRENRRSKRKGYKDSYVPLTKVKPLVFEEPSSDTLHEILKKIKRKKRIEIEQTIFFLVFSVIFVTVFLIFDYLYFFS